MANEVLVAIISVSGSLIIAAVSYFFAKRQQREAEWRDSKLNHYKVLLSSMSDLAVDNQDTEAHRRFALAINTLALVAPQDVIKAMLAFHDEIRESRQGHDPARHDQLLGKLLLVIRKDLGMKPKDDPLTFQYHLIGVPLKKKK
jgi:hypothetical protein